MKVIGLTGQSKSKLTQVSDIGMRAPQKEIYMIQELHLPIYHCWCMMIESRFFVEKQYATILLRNIFNAKRLNVEDVTTKVVNTFKAVRALSIKWCGASLNK